MRPDQIADYEFYKVFQRFETLPEHAMNSHGALKWLSAMVVLFDMKAADALEQIPRSLVTDEIREYAFKKDVRSLALVHPEDTSDYTKFCVSCYLGDYRAAEFFHESIRTSKTVGEMIYTPGVFVESYKAFPWIADVITPAQIEEASILNMRFMLIFPDEEISEQALKSHLERQSGYYNLKKAGRLHLAASYLKSGGWPETYGPFQADQEKPSSIEHAFAIMLDDKGAGCPPLYMAYVMGHPIEEVIMQVKSMAIAKAVLEMYGERELQPFMKSNRHLKASLLEESLGL
jgi:hypothetical protein